jgi:hypothetical protein
MIPTCDAFASALLTVLAVVSTGAAGSPSATVIGTVTSRPPMGTHLPLKAPASSWHVRVTERSEQKSRMITDRSVF